MNMNNNAGYQTIVARRILSQIKAENPRLHSLIVERLPSTQGLAGMGEGDDINPLDWISESVGSIYGEAKELYGVYLASDNKQAAAEASIAAAQASQAAELAKLEIARAQQDIEMRRAQTKEREMQMALDAEKRRLAEQSRGFNLNGIDPNMLALGGAGVLLLLLSGGKKRKR